jgi:biopolymer transport protein TolQ
VNSSAKLQRGMTTIFQAGLKEFIRYNQQKGAELGDIMEATRRAMRASYNREMDHLDAHLPFLASVGSVSPYIGLFGTVWGIMNAFRGLSNVAQATLSQVAPGIAEALVATAIGLFAAIPAVIAYNRFVAKVDRMAVRYESFIEEFTNILQRRA